MAQKFDTSTELKALFNRCFEQWKRKHSGGLDELAQRLGASPSYLSHIGRYGRVPGRPILILLALNFELENPQQLFNAAGLSDPWPYQDKARISTQNMNEPGFLSVRLDMDGLANAIGEVLQGKTQHRSIEDLTRGRPLRIGLNEYQEALFVPPIGSQFQQGFFLEFCDMLAMTLRCRIETIKVPFCDYSELLKSQEIDLYGPKIIRPQTYPGLTSNPICRIGLYTMLRRHPATKLSEVAPPKSLHDLQSKPYQIAVPRNSRSHLFSNIVLQRTDEQLILCDSVEELTERITLSGISRPAHLAVINAPTALSQQALAPEDIDLAFNTPETALEVSDNCFAVRPDWPDLVPLINQSIHYLLHTGALQERMGTYFTEDMAGAVLPPLVE